MLQKLFLVQLQTQKGSPYEPLSADDRSEAKTGAGGYTDLREITRKVAGKFRHVLLTTIPCGDSLDYPKVSAEIQ